MATIEMRRAQNGKRSYRVKVRLLGHAARSKTFDRRTDAKAWIQAIEGDLKRGRHVPTSEAMRCTVGQMVDRYLEETLPYKSRNLSRQDMERCLKWWKAQIGEYALANVTPAVINEYKLKLARGKYKHGENGPEKARSPGTVNRYLGVFGACLKTAVREYGWLESSPMPNVSKLQEPRGRIRFLDDAERGRLLEACKPDQDLYTLVLLALSTGARQGELLGLKWKDVDLKRGVIVLHDTKNRDRRVLPLAGLALDLMRDRAKVRRIDSERVWPSHHKPGVPFHFRPAWDRALAEAKIENFRFHDLRHSAASYLAMNGATLAEIAEILGHRTLAMVKRYAHLSDSHVSKVVGRMNAAIFGGAK